MSEQSEEQKDGCGEAEIRDPDPGLYNVDLAPVPSAKRRWGWFAIFNVWSNTAQSLLGYTVAVSLFTTFGLNGWAVFGAILLAGAIIAVLVNVVGQPSTRYGIPYPVMARAAMGVFGANVPAMVRAVVAVFWYGAQTYVASAAVALAVRTVIGQGPGGTWLGLDAVGWASLALVSVVQVILFWRGIAAIRHFLNFAAPAVYLVMLVLLTILWTRAGKDFIPSVGVLFEGSDTNGRAPFAAFMAVVGTMIAFYAPIIVNYGDFSRYVRSQRSMKLGNWFGIMVNIAFFALITLLVTAGARVVFGETISDPTEMIERVGDPALTVVAALTFFVATVGINVVANFVPPANDFANLWPKQITFRRGGLIAAILAFVVSAFWVTTIQRIGLPKFVDTLGAFLAPAYGILVVDYYLHRRKHIHVGQLYSTDHRGEYYYTKGWNVRALVVFFASGAFSVLAVWLPQLKFLSGFDWLIGAALAGGLYWAFCRSAPRGRFRSGTLQNS